ncbi:MAG: hypothetical protein ACI9JL_001524 [Paracoccaceae bacterium]|jgi:hypothetical protein
MGIARLKSACGAGIGILTFALTVTVGVPVENPAFVGSRLYDMSRMLLEPHPFQNPHLSGAVNAVQPAFAPRPTVPAGRAFYQKKASLPDSRYRSANSGSPSGASPVFLSTRQTASSFSPKMAGSATPTRPSFISVIVLGGLSHDPGQDHMEADTFDVNLEIVFRKVTFASFENRYLKFLFSPHPVLGGTINTEDETHTAYLALGWQYQSESGWFVGASFGFAYHTGNLHRPTRDCRLGDSCTLPGLRSFFDNGDVYLGSQVLFRESIELGYRLAGRHGISVYLAHMSNAGLFDDDNDGMNFAGLRYRYAFD